MAVSRTSLLDRPHSHLALLFAAVLLLLLSQQVNAKSYVGGSCTSIEDCAFPYQCLEAHGSDRYSLSRAVRPATACSGAGSSSGCICMQPSTVAGECLPTYSCDPSKTCSTSADCATGQFCFVFDKANNFLEPDPCTPGASCTCATPDDFAYQACTSSKNCDTGARCGKVEDVYSNKCVDCNLLPGLEKTIYEYTESVLPTSCKASDPTPTPTSTPTPTTTPAPATPTSTPPTPKTETDSNTTTTTSTPSSPAGTTTPEAVESSPATSSPASEPTPTQTSSAATSPTPTTSSTSTASGGSDSATSGGEDSDVCIDVKMLRGFESHELVFAEHRRAAVLCDSADNCATPGHMVSFRGTPMTMKRYCSTHQERGCNRMIKYVNSPRMKRGLRIASSTPDLEFTSLSAKYGSAAEEWILSKVLRYIA